MYYEWIMILKKAIKQNASFLFETVEFMQILYAMLCSTQLHLTGYMI